MFLVEKAGEPQIAVIGTIGKHAATNCENTCYLDVVAAARDIDFYTAGNFGMDYLSRFLINAGCRLIVGESSSDGLASVAKKLGFKTEKTNRIWRTL